MGVSSGGIIAFEMAQQLVARGQKVAFLVLFDSPAPSKVERQFLPLNEQIENLIKVGMNESLNRVKGKIKARVEKYRYPSQSPSLALEQPKYNPAVFSPIGEGHFFEPYKPKPYPGKLTFFRVMDALKISSIRHTQDPLELTWRKLCSELDYLKIPGSHPGQPFNILEPPHIHLLAEKLKVLMDNAS